MSCTNSEFILIEATFGNDLQKQDVGSFSVTLALEPSPVHARWSHTDKDSGVRISIRSTDEESRIWQRSAEERAGDHLRDLEIAGSDTPIYSTLLFLQEYITSNPPPVSTNVTKPLRPSTPTMLSDQAPNSHASPIARTLLRSHHLLSTQKRKSILTWSSELSLWGISKVGYPGIIIVEGRKEDVEEFERRIKGLNWLALSTRWQEVDPIDASEEKLGGVVGARPGQKGRVIEVESVSEVGEMMRLAGLEDMFQSVFRVG